MPGGKQGGPVGQGDYVVQPGDCMESIAYTAGLLCQKLWDHPANAELKAARVLNVLLPGDRVTIPEIQPFEKDYPTDNLYHFVLQGSKSKFQLRFLDDQQKPRAGVAYTMTIDGKKSSGTLDGNGSLQVSIPPNASQGSITLLTDPDPETYPLDLGHLDPETSMTGVRGRLNNLGFHCAATGDWDDELAAAVQRFQLANHLDTSAGLDDTTRQALKQGHLS